MKIILLFLLFQILKLSKLYGIYFIKNIYNNYYFYLDKNRLILSKEQTNFRLISIEPNIYYLETKHSRKKIGVNANNIIIKYNNEDKINNIAKIIWNITKINENEYFIQNYYNKKFIELNHFSLQCSNNINDIPYLSNEKLKNYKFIFIKVVDEAKIENKNLEIINNEPIDVVIKYIDLSDKSLKREGINQIYKDLDNEELRYSLRSILQYIPWVRKIYIIMPNEKVRYLKTFEEIKNKIIYVKDKDLLGYESANIHSFTFQLFKLEKFGISKNFIYMEDDFFIGTPLNKHDFFYYDEEKKKVLPYLLTKYFQEFQKSDVLYQYNKLYKNKEDIHPHSYEGWWISIYGTDKYFIEKYNNLIINTNFTHNAIAENIDELKIIFEEIKDYEYINGTLLSKERNILTLNQPHFLNLYQLNINHKKVHTLPYYYFPIEKLKIYKLNLPLFVINIGGNHIPTKRQIKIERKIMEKRFPFHTEYEIYNKKDIKKFEIFFYIFFNLFIALSFLRIIEIEFYDYFYALQNYIYLSNRDFEEI